MIRRAVDTEASAIAALVNDAFQVEREFRKGDRTDAAEIARLLARDVFFVALGQDGRLIGAVHAAVRGASGYFGMLAVDSGARGSGLGRALLAAAEEHCRQAGCTRMTLSTGEDRKELIPYYQRLGYRLTGSEISTNPAFKRPIRIVHMAKEL